MLADIETLASALRLPPDVVAEASKIYRLATKAGLFRGKVAKVIAGVATYVACRAAGYPCSPCEIARSQSLDSQQISRLASNLARELNIEQPTEDPAKYITRFCTELHFPRVVEERAQVVLAKAVESKISIGRPPHVVAAGILYFVTKHVQSGRTQKEIAAITCVSPTTLREYYAILLDIFLPGPKATSNLNLMANIGEEYNTRFFSRIIEEFFREECQKNEKNE
jgi:transcription initiation factor TFIIB